MQITVGGRWSRSTSANDAEARAYFIEIPGPILIVELRAMVEVSEETLLGALRGRIANW